MPAAAPSSLAVLARRAAFPPAKAASVAALSQRASSSSPSPSSSSLPPVPEPVKLPFELAEPKQRKSDDTLVIAHGLFGSKQNWRSLTRAFAQELGMPVYAVDLRNHGTAPHAEPHSYLAMASDVAAFFDSQKLTEPGSVHLMGHSMGGKAVMATALHPHLNTPLRSLISVDMSPAKGKISPEFASYADAMLEVEHPNSDVASKAQADTILSKYEDELSVRQFLLTNALLRDGKMKFRVPLELLRDSIANIGDFPFMPGDIAWEGPTLFIKGTRSKYINRHNILVAESFFPNMRLEELDTAHWVHAEKPREFVKLVGDFVREVQQQKK